MNDFGGWLEGERNLRDTSPFVNVDDVCARAQCMSVYFPRRSRASAENYALETNDGRRKAHRRVVAV